MIYLLSVIIFNKYSRGLKKRELSLPLVHLTRIAPLF